MYLFACALIAIGGLVSLFSWGTLIVSTRSERTISAVPLAGALPLGAGLAILPDTRPFAWLALIADYGTLAWMISLPRIAKEIWSTSRINLLYSFGTDASDRVISIKLFRRRVAVISVRFTPPSPVNDYGAHIESFEMVGSWAPTETGFSIDGYDMDRKLLITKKENAYTTMELNYPSNKGNNYDFLDGLVLK